MLKKVLFSLLLVGVSFLTGYATAQSYYQNNGQSAAGGNSDQSVPGTPTPSDFQSQVDQQNQKKNDALQNQLNQDLAKVPPPPAHPAPAAPPAEGQTAAPASNPAPTAKAPTTTVPSAAAPAAQPNPPVAATPSGPTPAAPPATAPGSSDIYTGFQNPGQNQSPSPAPNSTPGSQPNQPAQQSGGWNIKY